MNRRQLLKISGAIAGLAVVPRSILSIPKNNLPPAHFTYCLNMATIRGHKLGFARELEVASKAGFHGVEIWLDSLQNYVTNGGVLKDIKKRLVDLDLRVEGAIGFAEWIIDDETRRAKGLEQLKREMEMLSVIGCKRIAAPPAGATTGALVDYKLAAERYRAILELGDQSGVVPHLELWGFAKNCSRVSEVLYIALESGHPSARVLLDIYHLYKGGSGIETLPLINAPAVEILHMNDYPANKPTSVITDADRVYPGDGVAPIQRILQVLKSPARPLVLSMEVFNKTYYAQDALQVARTALSKMQAVTKRV